LDDGDEDDQNDDESISPIHPASLPVSYHNSPLSESFFTINERQSNLSQVSEVSMSSGHSSTLGLTPRQPAEWITTRRPLHSQSHYVPQVGDQCVYVSRAHMIYLSKVMEKKLYEVDLNKLDAAREKTKLFDQEQECRVKRITVAAYPPGLMHLRLETKLESTQEVITFEISMYIRAGLDDFLFLKEFYDRAMLMSWKQGDSFRRIIDGEWQTGYVEAECSNTCKFRSLRVIWDHDERVEFLSPWDLEPLHPDE
jgi:bromodomain and WD repeat domain-containing protein 1/3